MQDNKVKICGVDTSKLPVLKQDQMKQMLLKVKQGDELARDEFIRSNLKLVLSVIKRFSNRGEYADDLFQVGCIGLIKAVNNFDISQDVKFSTYAYPMIMGELRRYLRDNSAMRVSRSLKDTAYRALRVREDYVNEHGKEPTINELAELLDKPREEIIEALDSVLEPMSLNEPIYNDNGDAMFIMDQIKDASCNDEKWIENLAVRDAVVQLADRERQIINMRFFQGRTQVEVSEEIGISQAQVSRLEKAALKKMRRNI